MPWASTHRSYALTASLYQGTLPFLWVACAVSIYCLSSLDVFELIGAAQVHDLVLCWVADDMLGVAPRLHVADPVEHQLPHHRHDVILRAEVLARPIDDRALALIDHDVLRAELRHRYAMDRIHVLIVAVVVQRLGVRPLLARARLAGRDPGPGALALRREAHLEAQRSRVVD